MNLKYFCSVLLIVGLLVSCKSKKRTTTYKYSPKTETTISEEVVIEEKVVIEEDKKTPIINSTEDYILVYKDIAMEEMRVYKIPASITLAQGILESSSGKSELTLRSNNHFGIKCHKGWEGDSTTHDDDEKGECFRVYKDPRNSYKDHSEFLTSRSRYASLFDLNEGDYVGWAIGLSEAGYATDRRYPAKLIALIEKYNLHQYDEEVIGKSYKKPEMKKIETYTVVQGDTLYSISKKYSVSIDDIKKLNGLKSNNIAIGQTLVIK
jgi:flagellum-specific peptidoglycan hydrolase FlgJ